MCGPANVREKNTGVRPDARKMSTSPISVNIRTLARWARRCGSRRCGARRAAGLSRPSLPALRFWHVWKCRQQRDLLAYVHRVYGGCVQIAIGSLHEALIALRVPLSMDIRLSSDDDGVSTKTVGDGTPNVASKAPMGEWPSRFSAGMAAFCRKSPRRRGCVPVRGRNLSPHIELGRLAAALSSIAVCVAACSHECRTEHRCHEVASVHRRSVCGVRPLLTMLISRRLPRGRPRFREHGFGQ